MINKGLIFDGLVFATYRDRALYIRTLVRDRPQWLKDNPGLWETIEDAERKDARSAEQEIGGEPSVIGPCSPADADTQSDSNDSANIDVRLETSRLQISRPCRKRLRQRLLLQCPQALETKSRSKGGVMSPLNSSHRCSEFR